MNPRSLLARLAVLALAGAAAACGANPEPAPAPVPEAPAQAPAAPVAAAPQRQAPPAALAPRALQFPAFTEKTLPNGLRLIVVESHALPVIDLDLYVRAGGAADPRGKEGLASLTADLLTKGTARRSAVQISDAIEGVGGRLAAGADDDDVTVSASALSDQAALAFDLLSDVVLRPAFPQAELETTRTGALSALRASLGQPGAIAGRRFAEAVYGKSHPYGIAASTRSLESIRRADLQAFHREWFRPGNAMLVVAGDVTPAQAEEMARRYFGSWTGAPKAVTYPQVPQIDRSRVLLVNRPGSVQSNILIGHTGVRADNPDYFPLLVLSQMLGGGPDARLFQILRQQKGWTYGSYASLNRMRDLGHFQASAEVRTEVTDSALATIIQQIRSLRDEPVTAAELDAAKGSLMGSFPLRFETPGAIAERLATARLLGLDADYLRNYVANVGRVTAADVQRVARQYIHPDRSAIVVVGDAPKLLSRLEAIAPVTLVDVEGNPVDRASLEVRGSSETYSAAGLATGTLTYQLLVQGNPAGTATYALSREGQGWLFATNVAVPMAGLTQTSQIRFGADLLPTTYRETMSAGGNNGEIDVKVEGGRAKGQSKLPAQMGGEKAIDAALVPGTRFSGMETLVFAVADLAAGKTLTLPVFTPRTASTANVTARVVATEKITVPAGSFDTFKIETTGGERAVTSWVRVAAPHILVKQEIAGQPLSVQLQSIAQ